MPVLLKSSDLATLGWTPTLIKSLFGEPDEKEPYSRGIYRTTRYWYNQERVQAAMLLPAFQESQERRQRKAEAPALRREAFQRQYGSWRSALADACHGMHSLNRYAKHQTCGEANKSEIYTLKNALVEMLYANGYCSAAWEHILVLPPKKCFECGGVPSDWCDRCAGTGNYLSEKRLKFFCFRFNVGRGYTWHQPDKLVNFPVRTTAPPAEWSGVERDKPLNIPRSRLAAAKDLVAWVLDQAKIPEPEVVFLDHPIPQVSTEQQSLFA